MRVEVAALGLLLAATTTAAHGVHDVRGAAQVNDTHLRLELDLSGGRDASADCLRLLDELHVRDASGARLVGRRTDGDGETACVLEYELTSASGPLGLRLRPRPYRVAHAERIVLTADGHPDPLVLSARGNRAELRPLRAPAAAPPACGGPARTAPHPE